MRSSWRIVDWVEKRSSLQGRQTVLGCAIDATSSALLRLDASSSLSEQVRLLICDHKLCCLPMLSSSPRPSCDAIAGFALGCEASSLVTSGARVLGDRRAKGSIRLQNHRQGAPDEEFVLSVASCLTLGFP